MHGSNINNSLGFQRVVCLVLRFWLSWFYFMTFAYILKFIICSTLLCLSHACQCTCVGSTYYYADTYTHSFQHRKKPEVYYANTLTQCMNFVCCICLKSTCLCWCAFYEHFLVACRIKVLVFVCNKLTFYAFYATFGMSFFFFGVQFTKDTVEQ